MTTINAERNDLLRSQRSDTAFDVVGSQSQVAKERAGRILPRCAAKLEEAALWEVDVPIIVRGSAPLAKERHRRRSARHWVSPSLRGGRWQLPLLHRARPQRESSGCCFPSAMIQSPHA